MLLSHAVLLPSAQPGGARGSCWQQQSPPLIACNPVCASLNRFQAAARRSGSTRGGGRGGGALFSDSVGPPQRGPARHPRHNQSPVASAGARPTHAWRTRGLHPTPVGVHRGWAGQNRNRRPQDSRRHTSARAARARSAVPRPLRLHNSATRFSDSEFPGAGPHPHGPARHPSHQPRPGSRQRGRQEGNPSVHAT